jgi:hypothetical protein
MSKETLGTIVVVAGLALAGYLVYQHYRQAASTNYVGVRGGIGGLGISGNLNLNTLIGDIGGLFGGDDTGSA